MRVYASVPTSQPPSWYLRDIWRSFPKPPFPMTSRATEIHRLALLIERSNLDMTHRVRLFQLLKLLVQPQFVEHALTEVRFFRNVAASCVIQLWLNPIIIQRLGDDSTTLETVLVWNAILLFLTWIWVGHLLGDDTETIQAAWDRTPIANHVEAEYQGCIERLAQDLSTLLRLDPKLISAVTVYRLTGIVLPH